MQQAIEARGLVKRFGRVPALRGLDLSVAAGEIHGFIGPNGAGKSTTIRIVLGLLRADGGRAELLGGDPWRDVVRLHRRVAYVPGDVALWPTMTGGEAIDLLGRLRGGLDEARRADLVDRFELDPTKRGRQYSKGNKQKVAIVAALASRVDLLILDEPTSGLDPLMEAVFQREIVREKAHGRSVLLSTHILSEAEALADRLSIIRDGRTVETGTLHELRSRTRSVVTARLRRQPDAPDLVWFHDTRGGGDTFTGAVDQADLDAAMRTLAGCGIRTLTIRPPSLEDLFLRYYDENDDA
jgi:ABC-2 type transport system ATP-binding protein